MVITVINNFLKEGCKAKYLEIAEKFAKDVLDNEKGCLSFDLVEDDNLKDNVIMIIKWNSEEDLNNHNKGEIFPKYKPAFKECFIKNEVQVYKSAV